MPRNIKCRHVCADFDKEVYTPSSKTTQTIILNVDELEAIRLCDYEELEQEKAAQMMKISRGTLWRLVVSARKKIAMALTQGYGIQISGGNYEVRTFCDCKNDCKKCMVDKEEK